MKKIYYNIEQLTNAIATGLLGLATLGPMTSCEKNEPGNSNQYENFYDKGEANNDDEENDKGQNVDNGEVSKEDFVYGDYKDAIGDTYYYFYSGDSTDRADQKIVNDDGTFLNCFITTNEGDEYEISFIKDKGDLKLYDYFPYKEKTLAIFNKYRIEDKYYTERGFNPPVLPLK